MKASRLSLPRKTAPSRQASILLSFGVHVAAVAYCLPDSQVASSHQATSQAEAKPEATMPQEDNQEDPLDALVNAPVGTAIAAGYAPAVAAELDHMQPQHNIPQDPAASVCEHNMAAAPAAAPQQSAAAASEQTLIAHVPTGRPLLLSGNL